MVAACSRLARPFAMIQCAPDSLERYITALSCQLPLPCEAS